MSRRVRSSAPVVTVVVSVVAAHVAAAPAFAQDASDNAARFSLERFRPALDRNALLDVEWGDVGPHLGGDIGLDLVDGANSLTLSNGAGRQASVVQHRFGGNLVASMSFFEWMQLGVDVPFVLYQASDGSALATAVTGGALTTTALGDVRVVPKVRLLRSADQGIDLAVIPAITLPTAVPVGDTGSYVGEGQPTFVPELAVSRAFVDGALHGLRLAGNFGYRMRATERDVLGLTLGNELVWRAGVGFDLSSTAKLPLELDVTASGAISPAASGTEESAAEVLVGARYDVTPDLLAWGGIGTGVLPGVGVPDVRGVLGVRYSPRDWDHDDDGVLDVDDRCKLVPEDKDGHADLDGCPDPDNDGDGVLDPNDRCDGQLEDADGFEDDDGCPDLDDDKDGVADADDACRLVAGPVENKGCPWPDSDGDSILDKDDACVDKPGTARFAGCPDTDNDGVEDKLDRCVDKPGAASFGGCPDTDHDGFADDQDKCPTEPETVNNINDDDGCPDEGRSLVNLTSAKIEILDKVFFDTGKSTIQQKSFALLDQVATVLKSHAELKKVRIEGHTDDKGDDAKNLQLSQDRANAVRDYLVSKGVDAARLEAVGYGETKPVGDNKKADGREQNRRVEFAIVEQG